MSDIGMKESAVYHLVPESGIGGADVVVFGWGEMMPWFEDEAMETGGAGGCPWEYDIGRDHGSARRFLGDSRFALSEFRFDILNGYGIKNASKIGENRM